MTKTMALFEISNLSHTYHNNGVDTPVLHDISFKIEKGEFVSIMGPSGSGKSTLLHILGFLLDHTSGMYKFNDKIRRDYDEDEIARVRNKEMGFIFQSFNLLPRQTVFENVGLTLAYSGIPKTQWKEKIDKVIDIVDLRERLDFATYKLSGGEKQRTAIARALVNDPQVIFADEPTGNLDSESSKAVMEKLDILNREFGHTIVLITHEEPTAKYAERIIRIWDGRIESDKTVDHVERTNGKTYKK